MAYTVTGAETVTGTSAPQTLNLKPGDCHIAYKSGGPEGAFFTSVTPVQGSVNTGQTTAFTMSFVANKLNIAATLDGKPWEGPCEFIINPPGNESGNVVPVPGSNPAAIDGAQQVTTDSISIRESDSGYHGTVVPAVFDNMPNDRYRLQYVSGGPPDSRLETVSPANVQLVYGQDGTLTMAFTTKGLVNIDVLVDGQPWTGQADFSLYHLVMNRPAGDADRQYLLKGKIIVPDSTALDAGTYLVTFPQTLPNGAKLVSHSPDVLYAEHSHFYHLDGRVWPDTTLITVDNASAVNCEFNYTTRGSITVNGLKDGAPWSGPCEYSLTAMDINSIDPDTGMPTSVIYNGHELPFYFTGLQPGQYLLTYTSGGPEGIIPSITPSAIQTVEVPGNTGYTLEFNDCSITVTGSIYSSAWTGECHYIINGPVSRQGTEIPFTFTGLPAGQYTMTYLSGGPEGYIYWDTDVKGTSCSSHTLELTRESREGGFNAKFILIPPPVVVVPPAGADLAVTLSVDDPAPAGGTILTYTLTVTNNGPVNTTGVEVTFNSGGLAYSSDTSGGTYNSVTGVWTVGNLNSGASATITIDINSGAHSAPDVIVTNAQVTNSSVADPTPANNIATVTLNYT